MTDIEVSVVIPCLNEEKTIKNCIESAFVGIKNAGITGEVVVSDNGSTDRSIAISKEAGARVVECNQKGYGNALRTGFDHAQGTWILMGDADESYDFTELPEFKKKIDDGYDLVMGNRLGGKIEKGAMPFLHKYIGNPLLSFILKVLFKSNIQDSHCGLRAFTKSGIKTLDLRTGGMELASEMVIKASKCKLATAQIPITLYKDARDRPPHLRTFSDGWRHLRFMLLLAPNWTFVLPGLILALFGIVGLFEGIAKISFMNLNIDKIAIVANSVVIFLVGFFAILIGCFAKVFSFTESFEHTDLDKKLMNYKLEHGLICGSLLILAGITSLILTVNNLLVIDYGPQTKNILLLLSVATLGFGTIIIFASLFLSMLGISRNNYIGNYTNNR